MSFPLLLEGEGGKGRDGTGSGEDSTVNESVYGVSRVRKTSGSIRSSTRRSGSQASRACHFD